MPRRDGSGPVGYRSRRYAGRGCGLGLGMGCGYARGYGYNRMRNYNPRFRGFIDDEIQMDEMTEKEAISIEKELLESRLEVLNSHLNNLKED
jgi:uncharacterized protein DUF5320